MLEFGFNRTHYGKTVLAACFVNDLATVLALGLMFSPFTMKTVIFVLVSIAAFSVLGVISVSVQFVAVSPPGKPELGVPAGSDAHLS